MGGAVSAGRDNNELIDNLVESGYIKTDIVERVFRAIDRADYFLPASKHIAYKDLAWKSGFLHISAPCIYSDVMEWLKLRSGLSFLNLGSGTGYLSTMVGLILGTGGINHGIEINPTVVDYALDKLEEFILNSSAIDEFDFCYPKFVVGNCLCLSGIQQYDRVYCGAACPEPYQTYLKSLIKVGGILVMPVHGKLLQIKRKSNTEWVTKNIQHVSFASLVIPSADHLNSAPAVSLGDTMPASLQQLCRSQIRSILRNNVFKEKPHVKNIPKCTKREPSHSRDAGRAARRISLPVREEESDPDDFGFSFLHNLDRETGSREMNALLSLLLSMRRDVNGFLYEERNEGEQPADNGNLRSQVPVGGDLEESQASETIDNENNLNSLSVSEPLDNENTCCVHQDEDLNSGVTDSLTITSEVSTVNEMEPAEFSASGSCDNHNEDDENICHCDSPPIDTNSLLESHSPSSSRPSDCTDEASSDTNVNNERKRHYNEGDDGDDMDESITTECDSDTSSSSQCEKVKKMKRKSPPPVHEWDIKCRQFSDCVKEKVYKLPLPLSLKVYINMNRNF